MRPAAGALDLGLARLVAEDEQVRDAAVEEPERHAGVDRVEERALALDPEELAAARGALDDEPLGGARDEVGDDRVDGDAPAGDRDPRLPGRDEDRRRGRAARASRSSSSETVIFPIAQSEPTVSTIVARDGDVRARRGREIRGRPAQVAQLDAVARASSCSSGSSARNTCSPFSTSSPCAMQLRSSSIHAGGKRPPCVATPTSAVFGLKQSASLTRRDDRHAVFRLTGVRASSRGSRRRRRAGSGGRRASSCRSARRSRSPRRGSGSASQPLSAGAVERAAT